VLFPINWPEPFGLVMIEAMACGTPVVAFRCGSVPEIMEDGLTGYVVSDTDAAVKAVGLLGRLYRPSIRARFESASAPTPWPMPISRFMAGWRNPQNPSPPPDIIERINTMEAKTLPDNAQVPDELAVFLHPGHRVHSGTLAAHSQAG